MKTTWLLVGLGNPEGKYFQTYHNVGFLTADAVTARHGLQFKKKGNLLITDYNTADSKVFILKPLTYMNLSGQAVLAVARKQKIAPENIIIFTDDLYIDKGNIRITMGGSHAGHNGIRSINDLLKTNQYIKVRIGIKPAVTACRDLSRYVLSKIDEDSRTQIDHAIEKAVNAAMSLADGETLSKMQGLYNMVNTDAQNPK